MKGLLLLLLTLLAVAWVPASAVKCKHVLYCKTPQAIYTAMIVAAEYA